MTDITYSKCLTNEWEALCFPKEDATMSPGVPSPALATDDPDVLIVGAGHNGLTAGCYLARAGLRVTVVEASAAVGGMTSTNPVLDEAPGHRINEGAMDSSLWRTTTIARDLNLAGFGLRELEITTPYAFLDDDGSSLCVHRDPIRTADEIARFSRADSRLTWSWPTRWTPR